MKWRVISWVCHCVPAQQLKHLFSMINPLYPKCAICPVNLKTWPENFPGTSETTATELTNPTCIWHARGIQESINSLHSHPGGGTLLHSRKPNFNRSQKGQEQLKGQQEAFHKLFPVPKRTEKTSGKKTTFRVKIRMLRSHDEHHYPEVPFLSPGLGSPRSVASLWCLGLLHPNSSSQPAWSPVMTALTKWSKSVIADWYLPLHLSPSSTAEHS